jgi:hypothetical protein
LELVKSSARFTSIKLQGHILSTFRPLKTRPRVYFEASVISHPVTRRYIPERRPQLHRFERLKSCKSSLCHHFVRKDGFGGRMTRFVRSRDSSVGLVTRIRVGLAGVQIPAEARYIPVLQNVQTLWGPSSLLFNGHRSSFAWIKRVDRDVDHSPPSNSLVKNEWRYACTSPIRLHGVDRNNFTFFIRILCKHI